MDKHLRKAGRVVREALQLAKKMAKPEVSLLEIAEKVEEFIKDNGCLLAFPVNLSLNHIAAHYTPKPNDNTILKEGDVLKIDVGAHNEGWIVDAAITVEVNDNKFKDLIIACRKALDNVKKVIKKDITLNDVGKIIEETLEKYGYKPIYNLSGHEIKKYKLHAGLTIPNYANGNQNKLREGIYAIEPFATNGNGYVKDANPSTIYVLKAKKPVRIPYIKRILDFIEKNYFTLPFAKRWLYKEFKDKTTIDMALNFLKRESVLHEYPILVEKSKGIVVQFETTFKVNDQVRDLLEE